MRKYENRLCSQCITLLSHSPSKSQEFAIASVALLICSLMGCHAKAPGSTELKRSLEKLTCEVSVQGDSWMVHAKPTSQKDWERIVELMRGIPRLFMLVDGPAIDDNALSRLDSLKNNLYGLSLYSGRFSDMAASHIARLTALETLTIGGSPLSDKGVAQIVLLPRLHSLDLRDSKITNEALKHLASCTSLKQLLVDRTAITDEGIKYCRDMRSLQSLSLGDTRISDACIPELSQLKSLRELAIYGTRISQEGAERLTKRLPSCQVLGDRRASPTRLDNREEEPRFPAE